LRPSRHLAAPHFFGDPRQFGSYAPQMGRVFLGAHDHVTGEKVFPGPAKTLSPRERANEPRLSPISHPGPGLVPVQGGGGRPRGTPSRKGWAANGRRKTNAGASRGPADKQGGDPGFPAGGGRHSGTSGGAREEGPSFGRQRNPLFFFCPRGFSGGREGAGDGGAFDSFFPGMWTRHLFLRPARPRPLAAISGRGD